MQEHNPHQCQVCFAKPTPSHPYQELIQCKKCGLRTHRYCYLPSWKQNTFLCDGCQSNYQGKCKLCNNNGLLKRFDNSYAHPICLLTHSSVIVANWTTLKFEAAEKLKLGRKNKCSHCQNSTGNVLKCCAKKCNSLSHIYCALKFYQAQNGKGWKSLLQPLEQRQSVKQANENLLLRTLKTTDKFISGQLNIKKDLKTVPSPIMLYCHDHATTIVECSCRQFIDQNLDWIYCDGCCRWKHLTCVKVTTQFNQAMDNSDALYICEQCEMWKQCISNNSQLPIKFPKLQLYDFVWLHKLLQEKGQDAAFQLIDLAERTPILAGAAYGKAVFKKQLARKLKGKINLSALKKEIQQNPSQESIANSLLKYRDTVELIWWLVEGTFTTPTNQQRLPHILEPIIDPAFICSMLSLIVTYQKQYATGRSNIFVSTINKIDSKMKYIQPSPKKKDQKRQTVLSVSNSKKQTILKSQEKMQNFDKQLTAYSNSLYQQMSELVESAELVLKQNKSNLNKVIESLFQSMKQPKFLPIFEDLPNNNFLVSMNQDTPKHAQIYLKYSAEIEIFYCQLCKIKKELSKNELSKNVSETKIKNLNKAVKDWLSLKKTIIVDLGQHEKIQRQLILKIQSLDPSNEWLFHVFTNSLNEEVNQYQTLVYDKQVTSKTTLREVQSISFFNSLRCKHSLQVYFSEQVLSQLKIIDFKRERKILIMKQIDYLRNKPKINKNIMLYLEQYISLWQSLNKLCAELNIVVRQDECLFEVWQRSKNMEYSSQHIQPLVQFLIDLRKIRLNLFKVTIQHHIRSCIESLANNYYKIYEFSTEVELTTMKYWFRVFQIKLTSDLQYLIKTDQQIQKKYMFVKLQFQNPVRINELQKIFEQDLSKYTLLKLSFRISVINIMLGWISAYRIIINRIPTMNPLNSLWNQDSNQKKMRVQQLMKLETLMNNIHFPQGPFKDRVDELARAGREMRQKFEKIVEACDWSYLHNSKRSNWTKKIQMKEIQEFIKTATALPLHLEVEIIQCQIIIQKFVSNENVAKMLLLQIDRMSHKAITKAMQQNMRQIINHFGQTPIKSKYTSQLLQLVQKLQTPQQSQRNAEKLFNLLVTDPKKVTYCQAQELLTYFRDCYQGSLDKDQSTRSIKKVIQPVTSCLQEYQDIIHIFVSAEKSFNDRQLERVNTLIQKYQQLSVKHLTLEYLSTEIALLQQIREVKSILERSPRKAMLTHQELLSAKSMINGIHPSFKCDWLNRLNDTLDEHLERIKKIPNGIHGSAL